MAPYRAIGPQSLAGQQMAGQQASSQGNDLLASRERGRKVHLAMETATSDIRAVALTPSSDGGSHGLQANRCRAMDSPVLLELLHPIPQDKGNGVVTADAAHDTRSCHTHFDRTVRHDHGTLNPVPEDMLVRNETHRRGEVITGFAGRRYWSAPGRTALLIGASSRRAGCPGGSVFASARRNGVAPALMLRWRRPMDEAGAMVVRPCEPVVGACEVRTRKDQMRALERMHGAPRPGRPRSCARHWIRHGQMTDLASAVPSLGRFPISRVAEVLFSDIRIWPGVDMRNWSTLSVLQ